jgi:hypothetical protein
MTTPNKIPTIQKAARTRLFQTLALAPLLILAFLSLDRGCGAFYHTHMPLENRKDRGIGYDLLTQEDARCLQMEERKDGAYLSAKNPLWRHVTVFVKRSN